jgi:hypothetical protein
MRCATALLSPRLRGHELMRQMLDKAAQANLEPSFRP